ncbi:MAG: aminomethyltransferase family protein [Phycisphaeraceae bacterium]|nr:aminomethyltransferase family protein [Phycisphaeraceae bacterium]MBX3406091.1 aminomethyltransferase family protein [Phycisphaeraceae bacterium]
MARMSPMLELYAAAGAPGLAYGPEQAGVHIAIGFAPFALEYAAIRTGAAALDCPHRGVVVVRGADRHAFLQRMITQDVRGMGEWSIRRGFWLNRKGRIDADLEIIELPPGALPAITGDAACSLLVVDVHAAQRTVETLSAFVIADDVEIEDLSERTHMVQVHGPAACAALAAHCPVGADAVLDLERDRACAARVATPAGPRCTLVTRTDTTGEIGLTIIAAASDARAIYEAISDLPPVPDRPDGALAEPAPGPRRARRIGWHAFNVARLEAGTPLYNVDFGPTSLPHETGRETLLDRVSFKKGCYLGQEVVARMESLGHPKQQLVALRLDTPADAPQPVTGSHVLADPAGQAIGAVTSSAVSPMLSGAVICLAMVKHAHAAAETILWVRPTPDSPPQHARVQPHLASWRRP